MSWIEEHKRDWRIALLVLLLVGFLGPWTFDRINVPAEYTCDPPYIRLEGDFCGVPLSGIWLYPWLLSGLIYSITGLLTRELVFTEWIREFLFSLLLFLSQLPFLCTLLLIRRGDNQLRQTLTIIAWIFAIGFSLFWGLNNPSLFWQVWGIWLYFGLAISALILEIIIIVHKWSKHR